MIRTKFKFNPETESFDRVKKNHFISKGFLILIVVLASSYFFFGLIAVVLNFFSKDSYLLLAAIIGGLASVSGLLALITNKLQLKDIEEIGIEYFQRVVDSSRELQLKEKEIKDKVKQLNKRERELQLMDVKKQQMEYLIQKASMSLFLKDQFNRTEARIGELIYEDEELQRLMSRRQKLKNQLKELEEEIEVNEQSEALISIIEQMQKADQEKSQFKNTSFLYILRRAFHTIFNYKI